jgi:hypothetical protein
MDSRVLGTNALEDAIVGVALSQGIPAEDLDVVRLEQIVAGPLEVNRGIQVAVRTQEADTLSADGDPRILGRCRPGRSIKETAKALEKQRPIGHAIHHDPRKDARSILRNVGASLNGRGDVDVLSSQPFGDTVSVRFSGKHNGCLISLQAARDEASETFDKSRVMSEKNHLMMPGRLDRMPERQSVADKDFAPQDRLDRQRQVG